MTAHTLIGTPDRIPGINVYHGAERIRIVCECGWVTVLRPMDEHLIRHRIRHHLADHLSDDTEAGGPG
jgi:hypothetical protein